MASEYASAAQKLQAMFPIEKDIILDILAAHTGDMDAAINDLLQMCADSHSQPNTNNVSPSIPYTEPTRHVLHSPTTSDSSVCVSGLYTLDDLPPTYDQVIAMMNRNNTPSVGSELPSLPLQSPIGDPLAWRIGIPASPPSQIGNRTTTVHEKQKQSVDEAASCWNPILLGVLPNDFLELPAEIITLSQTVDFHSSGNVSGTLSRKTSLSSTGPRRQSATESSQRKTDRNLFRSGSMAVRESNDSFSAIDGLSDQEIAILLQDNDFLQALQEDEDFMRALLMDMELQEKHLKDIGKQNEHPEEKFHAPISDELKIGRVSNQPSCSSSGVTLYPVDDDPKSTLSIAFSDIDVGQLHSVSSLGDPYSPLDSRNSLKTIKAADKERRQKEAFPYTIEAPGIPDTRQISSRCPESAFPFTLDVPGMPDTHKRNDSFALQLKRMGNYSRKKFSVLAKRFDNSKGDGRYSSTLRNKFFNPQQDSSVEEELLVSEVSEDLCRETNDWSIPDVQDRSPSKQNKSRHVSRV